MATRKRKVRGKSEAAEPARGADRPTRLVYIHGIGRQEPRDELRRMWDLALFGKVLDATAPVGRTRMAYWADVLHDAAPAGPAARRTVGIDDRELDLDAVLADAGFDDPPAQVIDLATGLLAPLRMRPRSGPGKRVLPLPGFLRRPLARWFLKAFVGDTAAYFFQPEVRERIRERLRAELPDDPAEEVVLVSHSMGTVIAFEVLHERAAAGRPVQVRQFVTLGSPLGITEVQDNLAYALAVPDQVRQWVNFADPLDPVALDKGLGGDFAPRRGEHGPVHVDDRLIVNERTTRGNPHSSLGYLADPKVRTSVAQAIRWDPMGRFLVARDVAAALGDGDQRQPVLIEIVEPGHDGERADATEAPATLADRIADAAANLERIVAQSGPGAVEAARIDPLRHFVAAHLLPHELMQVTDERSGMLVWSVWKSSSKRKLVLNAARGVQADAARSSYHAAGRDVHWAVLDTGVQADHPHFQRHRTIAAVWDCTQPGPPRRVPLGSARDHDGHGTHVCGILAGEEADPAPGAPPRRGLAPEARLHVYRVLDDQGEGEDAWIIKALDHIAAQNADRGTTRIHGINLSLGGPFDSTVYGCGFSPICQELRRLWRDGVLVVVASGNEGKIEVETSDGEVALNSPMSIGDPANLEECIAVGSVHHKRPHLYGVSGFSSRGPTADGRLKPDVVAPGERIESCSSRWHDGAPLYRKESGTSMAAPVVSGLLASYLSARNEFLGRPDEVKALLLRTCNDLGRDRYHQGHGLPNLMKMLLES
ncbi:MAG: S8 family peptidase [Planctomycetes bacterium]|nr:S8 family peptidase [Planctomycetota bacterium]